MIPGLRRLPRCRQLIPIVPSILCIAAMLVLGLGVLFPRDASAHAFLVRTSPQSGERLDASPQAISLQFSEPVVGGEQVTVTTGAGKRLETGPIERLQDGTVLRAQLPPVEDDVYVVSWQVLADDGHLSVGEFAFAVGVTEAIPAGSSQHVDATAWATAATGGITLVGLLLAFGGLASEQIVWAPLARRHGTAVPRPPVIWLLLLALLGAILHGLLLVGQSATNEPLIEGRTSILGSRPGLFTLVEVGFIAYAMWLSVLRVLRPWAIVPLGLALAAAALRGHASTSDHWWAAPANVIHLVAVGFWVGALGHLLLVAWRLRGGGERPALIDGARRYARLALGLVAVVLASGIISASAQLARVSDLLTTRYGQLLLAKLLLVTAALGLAFAARRLGLAANSRVRPGILRRLTRAEGVALMAAVAVAAVLAHTTPPQRVTATENLLGPPPLEGPILRLATLAGSLAVHLAAAEDTLQVRALPPSEGSTPEVHIAIHGQAPDGTVIDVAARRCGPGCVTTAFPWHDGTTELTVAATSEAYGGDTVEFAVPWPPQPEDPALLERVIAVMGAQPTFTLTERVSSGPDASATRTFSISGAQFMELELYARGGASDIRPIPVAGDVRALTLYLSGSAIWYTLEIDDQDRLQREIIVSRGHLIERTFDYDR